jgi:hypothetical protein
VGWDKSGTSLKIFTKLLNKNATKHKKVYPALKKPNSFILTKKLAKTSISKPCVSIKPCMLFAV